MVSLEQVVE